MVRELVDVLLVEDDPDDATHIQRLLVEGETASNRRIDIGRVHHARTLEAARESFEREPDVILLDLNLPDSSGLDTVSAVTAAVPQIPVVVNTGTGESDLGEAAINRGAQDYLRKSRVTAPMLDRTIRYAIERHRQQREIRTLNRRLTFLNGLLRDEIRTDVNVVIGRSDQLLDRVDDANVPLVESVLSAADSALERTETAAALTETLSPDHEVSVDQVDIGSVLDAAVSQQADRHGITIERAWSDPPDCQVLASPMLRSAFEELLTNAVRHNDSETPTVRVGLAETPDSVTVSIADDGVGISPARRDLLADPERRFSESAGIGSGLFLATTVVEQSGGHIAFEDNEPRGTVVRVTLPRPSGDLE